MNETSILVLHPGYTPERRTISLPPRPTLPELCALVERLYIGATASRVPGLYRGTLGDLFIDEFGSTRSGTARNETATDIFRGPILHRDTKLRPEQLCCIYGSAVFFFRPVVQ